MIDGRLDMRGTLRVSYVPLSCLFSGSIFVLFLFGYFVVISFRCLFVLLFFLPISRRCRLYILTCYCFSFKSSSHRRARAIIEIDKAGSWNLILCFDGE